MIHHLLDQFLNDPSVGIAYIYCNFQRQSEQKADDLLASLLKQLAQLQSPLPQPMKDLYDRHKNNRTRPFFDEISKTLHSVAVAYSKVFIIIDALDECNKSDNNRAKFLEAIFQLQASSVTNIFATSRVVDDIASAFDGNPCLTISANNGDILAYLNARMSKQGLGSETQDMIRTEMLKAADGMYVIPTNLKTSLS